MMTGKLRREITPFLWVCLMGLRPDCAPDEDSLVQASLLLSDIVQNFGALIWEGNHKFELYKNVYIVKTNASTQD